VLEGAIALPCGGRARVADLPGLYSLEAAVDEDTDEGFARRFLARAGEATTPLLVAQVLDVTQLALGLRLTRELARHGAPLVVLATQHDVLVREGRRLDTAALSLAIGVPVVALSAKEPESRARAIDAIDAAAHASPSCAEVGDDAAIAALAARVIVAGAQTSTRLRARDFTARVDAVLLHPALGPFLFLGLMALVFATVFLLADPATTVLEALTGWLGARAAAALGDGLLASFVTDGVLGGAGTVLAFMPQIVVLTVALDLLDASGYLARGAFLVDRLLRLLGLSGRAFVPLLMGHACAVPAIAATRIVRDPRERLTTILILPLMTCSARIPTYALLLGTFFAAYGAWVRALLFVGLYFAGIAMGLVASLTLRRTATRGPSLPLVLEMPAYRAPDLRALGRRAWKTAVQFTRDVGTMILAVSCVLWALLQVPGPGAASFAARIGHALEPVTAPLGFDWRINVGLLGSFGAREVMVGTMGVIFGVEGDDTAPLAAKLREAYDARTALALLAFFVIACQCMSTVAAIRRETRSWRWPAFVVAYTYGLAYIAAWLVHGVAGLLGIR